MNRDGSLNCTITDLHFLLTDLVVFNDAMQQNKRHKLFLGILLQSKANIQSYAHEWWTGPECIKPLSRGRFEKPQN